jgi:hypothetical protein
VCHHFSCIYSLTAFFFYCVQVKVDLNYLDYWHFKIFSFFSLQDQPITKNSRAKKKDQSEIKHWHWDPDAANRRSWGAFPASSAKFLVSSFPADGSPEEKPPRRKTGLLEFIIRIYSRCHPIDKRGFLAKCIYFLRVLFSLEHVLAKASPGV